MLSSYPTKNTTQPAERRRTGQRMVYLSTTPIQIVSLDETTQILDLPQKVNKQTII